MHCYHQEGLKQNESMHPLKARNLEAKDHWRAIALQRKDIESRWGSIPFFEIEILDPKLG